MSNPNRAPIASPDGNIGAMPLMPIVRGDWKNAPKIVRGWAYPLTWLGIIVLPLLILGVFALTTLPNSEDEDWLTILFSSLFLVFTICLNRGLKKGASWSWIGQIVLSCFGLLGFPLGTAIHGYILSQWFKPETQAWFGQI